ncbi:8-amino-7-oxononanoate synthase [Spectribacter hydrogenoxidans]|uniref:8-amino-7-oxononanoate synthase n=1 Tax=Spectribacter hydrogenoxidans TaxID=3075608 RepID=A0ABU3BY34_9GAMM|nr:8-amino-7-oxononanoate synthase [Salinisphaera sp. W335]MDT0634227.1 8-amino-7-oxononanoate synthase [Salinisphaera sp. W335]
MTPSLGAHLARELAALEGRQRYRHRHAVTGVHGVRIKIGGRRCINFCSNDYLGLAADPGVAEAMAAAARQTGSGSGASQLISGHNRAHAELEEQLADYLGRPRALLFATGFAANVGIIDALMGKADTIVADALNHASLIDGARLSGAAKRVYAHADSAAADAQLAEAGSGHRLLVTDSVFSMDGDLAPLPALMAAAARRDAWTMVDDAHGFGVLGGGRGACAAPSRSPESRVPSPDVYVATLGKSVGAAGAFVAGDEALIEYLIQRARTLIFSTAPPPAVAAAASAGLRRLQADQWRRDHLFDLIARFRRGCEQLGIVLDDSIRDLAHASPETRNPKPETFLTPIQPLVLGSDADALAASRALLERGYLVSAIRPPTVPEGTARLRVTLTAAHDAEQVDGLLTALADCVRRAETVA